MTQKSFFSLSPPLIKEEFRKLWAIPALGFVALFFTCVFPIILNYGDLSNEKLRLYQEVHAILSNRWPVALGIYLIIPILSSLLIFRYLHAPGSVTLVHAAPFTRSHLLNSNFAAASLFCIVPLTLNGVILLFIATPVYEPIYENGIQIDLINVFTRIAIFKWMGEGILIMLFTLAISVFAGMVTGTSLHHFLGALGFNALAPGIYVICITYFQKYLYGYTVDSNQFEILYNLSPIISGARITPLHPIMVTVYIGVILIFYGLSMVLYYHRRLERATEGTVFKFIDVFGTIIIAFLGMTAMGMFFDSISDDAPAMRYVGYAIGAILALLIGRFLLKKSIRIFNRETAFLVITYALIGVLFVSTLRFDLTGFESRIPPKEQVSSAYGKITLQNGNYSLLEDTFHYTDPENIQHILNFHKRIVENREMLKNANSKNNMQLTSTASLKYFNEKKRYEDNHYVLSREFSVPYTFIMEDKNLKALFESKEYRDKISIHDLLEKDVYNVDLEPSDSYLASLGSSGDYNNRRIKEDKHIRSFIKAYEADVYEATFEEIALPKPVYGYAYLTYKEKDPVSNRLVDQQTCVNILRSYKHTIQWIEDHSYAEYMKIDPSVLKAAVIQKMTPQGESYEENSLSVSTSSQKDPSKETRNVAVDIVDMVENTSTDPLPVETPFKMIITDPKEIVSLISNRDTGILTDGDYYMLSIITTDGTFNENDTYGFFTEESLPDSIKDYFN